jgi:hypothetical protein
MDVSIASFYNERKKTIKLAKWGTPKKILKRYSNLDMLK